MAEILDRLRRRQARHAWRLTSELRRIRPVEGVTDLTPEDPPGADATSLLTCQAQDIRSLRRLSNIDTHGLVMLMGINSALVAAQSGLERIRNQPIPIHVGMFTRLLAWSFGIMIFNRLDSTDHEVGAIFAGFGLMCLFIVAERLGHFIEEPMNNSVFDLPMHRLCSTITENLLGAGEPLARPPADDRATIWM